MQFWLVKQEPDEFSWDDLVTQGRVQWDGVRNYQARNNLKTMRKDDFVLFYHSVKHKSVMGIAKVSTEAYPDPTTDDLRWVAVELQPVKALEKPVTLAKIKNTPELAEIHLIKQSRLSVMPLTQAQFEFIVSLGNS